MKNRKFNATKSINEVIKPFTRKKNQNKQRYNNK